MSAKAMLMRFQGLLLIMAMIGCGSSSESKSDPTITPTDIQSITYEYGDDDTLPPEDHRSYAITATSGSVGVVVDSHGNVLADETYELTPEEFEFIRNAMGRNMIRNCDVGQDDGCEGGTTESISFADAKKEVFYGSVYHCRGQDSGNLCGNIPTFATRMRNLVPNLQGLLELKTE